MFSFLQLIQKPRGAEGTILRPNVLPMWVREGDAMQDLNLKVSSLQEDLENVQCIIDVASIGYSFSLLIGYSISFHMN